MFEVRLFACVGGRGPIRWWYADLCLMMLRICIPEQFSVERDFTAIYNLYQCVCSTRWGSGFKVRW